MEASREPATAAQAWEALRRRDRPLLAFVSHGMGGGVSRYIAELATALEGRAHVLLLHGHGDDHVALRGVAPLALEPLWFPRSEWARLVAWLAALGVDRVHFHHVHGLPMEVLELPAALGCPHDVTVHDYWAACPAYHLKDGSLRYCGGGADCRRCLEAGRAQWPLSIDEWRARTGRLLSTAGRVIAPSQDAARRLREFFPALEPLQWPHPDERDAAVPRALRVIVPGALSTEKGLELLAACASDARSRGLPLHFRVAGFVGHPVPAWPEAPLSVSGEYEEGSLPALLAAEGGDLVFFPVQVPETFSYTLSAALATGLPIVATDLGALPERLAGRPDCRVVPWTASPGQLNDALLSVGRAANPPATPAAVSARDYAGRYLRGIARREAALPAMPVLQAGWLAEPGRAAEPSPMAWLFDDGVVAGRGASRAELRRRLQGADATVAALAERLRQAQEGLTVREAEARALRARLDALHDEAQQAQARAAALEAGLRSLESSRVWRMMAPVRSLARRLRLTRTRG